MPTRVIIMGAAGKDFHTFNEAYRGRTDVTVVAFTATQIPNIEGRRYPASLAGPGYPEGIPIHAEADLTDLIRRLSVDRVVFAYSDVRHDYVMHRASQVNAAGAEFVLHAPEQAQVRTRIPTVSVCAVRTGCGKSQTSRRVAEILRAKGKRVAVIRHPMPYGDLEKQKVQRFADLADMDKHQCTIEEREEYEQHIVAGSIVYAGVDYGAIAEQAEKESDILLWDGGNNDTPLLRSDLEIVLVDPHRPGHEESYHPGEINLRRAAVVVINKIGSAEPENVERVRESVKRLNPGAIVIEANSPITVENGEQLQGKRVLVIEDGPTLTHGEMAYGAGTLAARQNGAAELVDPRPWAVGSIAETFEKYPGIGVLLPAMGYGEQQMQDLQATIAATECDAVVVGTPFDLGRLIKIDKPSYRARYSLEEIGKPDLEDVLASFGN
jgi:predicted GTPase